MVKKNSGLREIAVAAEVRLFRLLLCIYTCRLYDILSYNSQECVSVEKISVNNDYYSWKWTLESRNGQTGADFSHYLWECGVRRPDNMA